MTRPYVFGSVALAAIVQALVCVAFARAEIYRYVDKNGNEHFVDKVEKVPPSYRNQVEDISERIQQKVDEGTVRTIKPPAVPQSGPLPDTPPNASEDGADSPDGLDYGALSWMSAPLARTMNEALVQNGAVPLSQKDVDDLVQRERYWLLPVAASWFWACLLALGLAAQAFRTKRYAWIPVVTAAPAVGIALLVQGARAGEAQWVATAYSALSVPVLYTTLYVGRTAPWRKAVTLLLLLVPWAVAAAAALDYYGWFKAVAVARGAQL